jgi:transcriptional regulator with XRE-family HTH domain
MFSKRFKELRQNHGYTHAELADLLHVGDSQIYRYEAGRAEPQAELLDRMADLFGVSVDYLLGRTNNLTPPNLELDETEARILSALRHGDKMGAIKVIVGG